MLASFADRNLSRSGPDRRKVELKNLFCHGEYEIVIQKSARTSALRLVPDRGEPRAPAAVGMLRRVVPNPVHAP